MSRTTYHSSSRLEAPDYLPRVVDPGSHRIGLIGCGGVSQAHLAAYRAARFRVTALCDRTLVKADARRREFFPHARATTSTESILTDPLIDIVDLATHIDGRSDLIRQALAAGKHVLSQKPFVSQIADGKDLIRAAAQADRLLAVNQNGRWAPHFAAALASVERGDIGEVTSADFQVFWPHDEHFEHDPHFSVMADLVLYDFGIHWFDIVSRVLAGAGRPTRVFAAVGTKPGQRVSGPTQADVLIDYQRARSSIVFRASSPRAEFGTFRIEGTRGVITHQGVSLGGSTVSFETAAGDLDLSIKGDWWTNGMTGTMAELMYAIERDVTPANSAASTLDGLALCFAALRSSRTGIPVDPTTVRSAFDEK